MSRRHLLASMNSAEMTAWEAFYRIEEEDRRREELKSRAAQGVKQIRNRKR